MMCKCRVWYQRFRVHDHFPHDPSVILVRGTHPGTWVREALRVNLSWALWDGGAIKWFLLPNVRSGKDYDPYRIGEVRLSNHKEYPHKVPVDLLVPYIKRALYHLSPIGIKAVLQALAYGGTLADFHAKATEIVFAHLGAEVKLPVWVPPPPPDELKDTHGVFSTPWVLFTLARMGWRAHAAGVAMCSYLTDPKWGLRYAAQIKRYEEHFGVEVGIIEVYPPPPVSFQARFKGLETQYTILEIERR